MAFIKTICNDFVASFKKSTIFRIFIILFTLQLVGTFSYSTYCMLIKDTSNSCAITFGASSLSLMIVVAYLLLSCLFYFIK